MNDVLLWRPLTATSLALAAALTAPLARADAVDALRAFVREAQSGSAAFTQVVTSPDGVSKKTSSGRFEFARPNRLRFMYEKPYTQTIVSDGHKVWFYDIDLNQVTVRRLGDALGATPAALLAGQNIERDFDLKVDAAHDGLDWAQATPKAKDGTIAWLKAGFKGNQLAAVEIADSFGQRSMLRFEALQTGVAVPAEHFRFTAPAGSDVLEQ